MLTPGHSRDSVCLVLPADRALLTGDTVLGRGTTVVAHPDGRLADYLGRYPRMRIVALAPEKNRGIYYWAMVDIRNKPVESSEAGLLNAIREKPGLVGLARS